MCGWGTLLGMYVAFAWHEASREAYYGRPIVSPTDFTDLVHVPCSYVKCSRIESGNNYLILPCLCFCVLHALC